MIDFVQVGNKIQYYRKKQNLSQEDLASKLFVTRQALSKWENGTSSPSIDTLLEMCTIFEISFEEILCLNEEKEIDIDPEDIFLGHNRKYVIDEIVKGNIKLNIPDVLYQMSPLERMTILKAVKEDRIKCNIEELVVKLTQAEQRYLFGGAYYVLGKIK